MPLLTSVNTNTIILQDIINWLSQIKIAGVANHRIKLGEPNAPGNGFCWNDMNGAQWGGLTGAQWNLLAGNEVDCTISFYTDAARTHLVFTDNTTDTPAWEIIGNTLYYVPPDSLINSASVLSATLCQALYYFTAVYSDGTTINGTYKNSLNLMFNSVVASNKKNPAFAQNANQAIVVPAGEKQEMLKVSGEHGYITASFDIYLQLTQFNWSLLSEIQRLQYRQQVTNIVRNALYADRYRNSTCTLKDANLNGTYVATMKPIDSEAVLKGVIRVDCVYWADGDSNF